LISLCFSPFRFALHLAVDTVHIAFDDVVFVSLLFDFTVLGAGRIFVLGDTLRIQLGAQRGLAACCRVRWLPLLFWRQLRG
jgi:hypothetical protein